MTIDALQPTEPPRDRYKRYLIAPRDGGKAKAYARATTVAEVLNDRYNLEFVEDAPGGRRPHTAQRPPNTQGRRGRERQEDR